MDDPEIRKLLAVETLAAEASELIARLMHERGITKAELARQTGKSRAWVTQLLSGKTNMTVRTLAEVAFTLEAEVKLQTETPRWKAASQPKGAGRQPAVFRMDSYDLKTPELFVMQDNRMKNTEDEIAPDGDAPVRPGYAA